MELQALVTLTFKLRKRRCKRSNCSRCYSVMATDLWMMAAGSSRLIQFFKIIIQVYKDQFDIVVSCKWDSTKRESCTKIKMRRDSFPYDTVYVEICDFSRNPYLSGGQYKYCHFKSPKNNYIKYCRYFGMALTLVCDMWQTPRKRST